MRLSVEQLRRQRAQQLQNVRREAREAQLAADERESLDRWWASLTPEQRDAFDRRLAADGHLRRAQRAAETRHRRFREYLREALRGLLKVDPYFDPTKLPLLRRVLTALGWRRRSFRRHNRGQDMRISAEEWRIATAAVKRWLLLNKSSSSLRYTETRNGGRYLKPKQT